MSCGTGPLRVGQALRAFSLLRVVLPLVATPSVPTNGRTNAKQSRVTK
jgi:hypothetical protein